MPLPVFHSLQALVAGPWVAHSLATRALRRTLLGRRAAAWAVIIHPPSSAAAAVAARPGAGAAGDGAGMAAVSQCAGRGGLRSRKPQRGKGVGTAGTAAWCCAVQAPSHLAHAAVQVALGRLQVELQVGLQAGCWGWEGLRGKARAAAGARAPASAPSPPTGAAADTIHAKAPRHPAPAPQTAAPPPPPPPPPLGRRTWQTAARPGADCCRRPPAA